jgi:hypothetical protein
VRSHERLPVGRERSDHDMDEWVADGVLIEELDGGSVNLRGQKTCAVSRGARGRRSASELTLRTPARVRNSSEWAANCILVRACWKRAVMRSSEMSRRYEREESAGPGDATNGRGTQRQSAHDDVGVIEVLSS